jgi:Na+/phosphate symporter
VEASKFYILILDYLQDMSQSIGYIVKSSYDHVNNNHKKLKFNQIRDLKGIDNELQILFDRVEETFNNESFENINAIIDEKQQLINHVSQLIQKQIDRIRSTETSPKNTKLYFGLLLETKDLISATMNLLQLFQEFHNDYKKVLS